jgi:hypothetical protein
MVGGVARVPGTDSVRMWWRICGLIIPCLLLQVALAEAQTPSGANAAADGGKTDHGFVHDAASAGRLALLIAVVGLLVIPLVWSLLVVAWAGIRKLVGKPLATQPPFRWGFWSVVGHDGRVSTSKTVAIVWTYAVAAGLLSIIIARLLHYPAAYHAQVGNGLQAEYALLLGGPIGAAILAKGIVNTQLKDGTASKPAADSTGPSDLVANDNGDTDLGDLQYVLFNLVALIFFFGELLSAPANGLPAIPDVLLGLTSVAAVGYVSKKTLTGAPAITTVRADAGPVGTHIRVLCTGIIQPGDDLSLITVAFGTATTAPESVSFTTTQGALLDVVVPDDAAGKPSLVVSSLTGRKAAYPGGFAVQPTIKGPASVTTAAPGEPLYLVTTGVAPLVALSQVSATIDAKAVPESALEPDDRLKIIVPQDTSAGPHKLELKTASGTASIMIEVRSPPAPVPAADPPADPPADGD